MRATAALLGSLRFESRPSSRSVSFYLELVASCSNRSTSTYLSHWRSRPLDSPALPSHQTPTKQISLRPEVFPPCASIATPQHRIIIIRVVGYNLDIKAASNRNTALELATSSKQHILLPYLLQRPSRATGTLMDQGAARIHDDSDIPARQAATKSVLDVQQQVRRRSRPPESHCTHIESVLGPRSPAPRPFLSVHEPAKTDSWASAALCWPC